MNTFVIEKEALCHNIKTILSRAGEKKVYAVIKGDGYGFGLCEYAKILMESGVSALAVTEPEEVSALRESGISCEILMMRSTVLPDEIESLILNDATLTVGSNEAAVAINGIAGKLGKKAKAHIKIDTGMGRYGYSLDEIEKVSAVYDYLENIEVCGIYTHLNAAFGNKKKTLMQIADFYSVVDSLRREGHDVGCVHFAASVAFFRFNDVNFADALRIGSAFTGRLAYPCKNDLKRVGHLESDVCELRWINKGATVGYGSAYRARSARKIAIVPLGYSHGFGVEKIRDSYRIRDGLRYVLQDIKRVIFGEKQYATLSGKKVRILGHIGMLHTVLDVTNIPCEIGDTVSYKVNPLYVNKSVARKYI